MTGPAEPPRRGRHPNLVFLAALGAILLALPLAYFILLGEEPAPVVAPPDPPAVVEAPAPAPAELQLSEVEGQVEIRRADGTWAPAQKGEKLRTSDSVRTQDGSYAVLVGGDRYEVKMEPGTEISVDELTDSISKILLSTGMATARVNGAARHSFEVRAKGSDAVAKTSAGAFSISNNGEGTVAVGTREGEVELFGQGKVVIVRAGQQSVVRPGQEPSAPAPIPSSLLLKVQWPAKLATRRQVIVSGEAEPGARVEVAGKVVVVDQQGRFRQPLKLSEGKNQLTVRALSVGGLSAEDGREVRLDTTAPSIGIDRDLWKKK